MSENGVSGDGIEYAVTEGRAEITLNRPATYNAFDGDMLAALNERLLDAQADDEVYVILLTGRGKGFCSGADVSDMDGREDRKNAATYGAHLWAVQYVNRQLLFGEKPTIAAVNGPAVGAGCDFALACDLRVMAEGAFLREQFVNIGLVPGDGGAWTLPRLIGESKAKEYLLTGRDITASDAEELGLVVDVVPGETLMRIARDLANEIRDKPARAVRNTKALVDTTRSFAEYCAAAHEQQWECVTDPEHRAAVEAVADGRRPELDRPR
ncbi:enoyl-CoA hydratase/isomerase family protein [Halorubrum sp. DTA46]|uniref:enoyl-CoA hydratase/isomerase family protein n=1 Tax=Halorubrum sp. DTA46 TaxID=3402162 RepID=UPI003AAEA12A